ncbi:MAG: IPT/TIG domain-containing protein, partial [Candidatus Rokubacteria bacterium]|nr:IPT/TIG domain-containing protein [Candidatus Rokubacteria bacterium]
AQTIVTSQNQGTNVVLVGTDAETSTQNLIYAATAPSHGTLVQLGGQFFQYTPAPDYSGPDSFTFTVTDRGNPDLCGTPSFTCAAALTSAPATVSIVVSPSTISAYGKSTPTIAVPAAGASVPQALGDVEIDESTAGAIPAVPETFVQLTLPVGMTFAAPPIVGTLVSYGLTVQPGADPTGGRTYTFSVGTPSTNGAAKVLISGISVSVDTGFVSALQPTRPVVVTLGGTNPAFLSSVTATNGTAVIQDSTPVPNDVKAIAGQGATGLTLTVTGANFQPDATVTFGHPGITATNVAVNAAGTQVTITYNVAANVPTGVYSMTIANPGGGSATLANAITVMGAPTISAITTAANGSPTTVTNQIYVSLKSQLVTVTGQNFEPATAAPLLAAFNNMAGISVDDISFTSPSAVVLTVSTGDAAALVDTTTPRTLTITNPDGGQGTSPAIALVTAPADAPVGLGAPKVGGTTTATVPSITSLTPTSGLTGTKLTISGSGFSSTLSSNTVNFPGAGGTKVNATPTSASSTSLAVTVPTGALTGTVTVTTSGVISNGVTFTVTNPTLSAASPSALTQGTSPSVTLTGSNFRTGLGVTVLNSATNTVDTTIGVGTVIVSDAGHAQLTLTIPASAATGTRDVTVRNSDGGTSTLKGALTVSAPPVAGFTFSIVGVTDISTYLPTVDGVTVALNATGTGACTAKSVKPTAVTIQALFTTTQNLAPPSSVSFALQSSALPGTAINEDCEPTGVATPDFSLGPVNNPGAPDVTVQQLPGVILPGAGAFQATLYSWDWGGTTTVTVTGTLADGTVVKGTVTVPIDTDADGMPDAYEKDPANTNPVTGLALDFQNPDQNANGARDGGDKFVADGLTNADKYRGIYYAGPALSTTGAMSNHQRLTAGKRHLFVRGLGFGTDPMILASPGTCGYNVSTGQPQPDATLRSYKDGTTATLDTATVVYDAVSCNGAEACDFTTKTGVRNWTFPTLGFSTFGSATAYAPSISVYKRAVESYFTNRPYLHQTNDPTRVVNAPDGTPMLAPITQVGDTSGTGADNGVVDTGEATVNGVLAGDVYTAGVFKQLAGATGLSAMAVTNDGCVQLPFVSDPTSIARCTDPTAVTGPASAQATKRQVVRSVLTHELGHGVGVNTHTTDSTDLMYQYSNNWIRDGHFSATAGALIQIHNKGQQ